MKIFEYSSYYICSRREGGGGEGAPRGGAPPFSLEDINLIKHLINFSPKKSHLLKYLKKNQNDKKL